MVMAAAVPPKAEELAPDRGITTDTPATGLPPPPGRGP